MGWVWKDDEEEEEGGISSFPTPGHRGIGDIEDDGCSIKKSIRSECTTEEVEPGKFVRKCQKTEEVLRSCVGKPVEVVKSNTEYTEDDVTNEMASGGGSFSFNSSEVEPFTFPGLRSDIEAIEKSMFGGLNRFLEATEEMRNGFFQAFGAPHIFERESQSPFKREVPIEGQSEKKLPCSEQTTDGSGYIDISGKVRDV
ncbi:hypothetical protein IFM89_000362 [Coptis chinensis]|uniref:Mal d 1-associated protein n=1 Tax=Coptis chinensis TaxID=261450 RepID=A0A835HBI5_9MAGN|nr:hypothetical protein IFM89_000362 [Coptis chinensis]